MQVFREAQPGEQGVEALSVKVALFFSLGVRAGGRLADRGGATEPWFCLESTHHTETHCLPYTWVGSRRLLLQDAAEMFGIPAFDFVKIDVEGEGCGATTLYQTLILACTEPCLICLCNSPFLGCCCRGGGHGACT